MPLMTRLLMKWFTGMCKCFFFSSVSIFLFNLSFISHVSNWVMDLTPVLCYQICILLPPFFCLYTHILTLLILNFSSAMSSPFPPLLTSVLFSVFLQAQTFQTVCITCLLSQWIFVQLHCYSIHLSVIFSLISMCTAPGAWVIAFGLQETWNKRAAPAPNTVLFEYKIINFWKQIRRGWRKVQKKSIAMFFILLRFLSCWKKSNWRNADLHGS